jgi:hypothetical protein
MNINKNQASIHKNERARRRTNEVKIKFLIKTNPQDKQSSSWY